MSKYETFIFYILGNKMLLACFLRSVVMTELLIPVFRQKCMIWTKKQCLIFPMILDLSVKMSIFPYVYYETYL